MVGSFFSIFENMSSEPPTHVEAPVELITHPLLYVPMATPFFQEICQEIERGFREEKREKIFSRLMVQFQICPRQCSLLLSLFLHDEQQIPQPDPDPLRPIFLEVELPHSR